MGFKSDKYIFKKIFEPDNPAQDEISLVEQAGRIMTAKKGQLLFREKSYSKGAFIIRKGKIKIFQVNREGKEQIAYIYRSGEILGYRPLLCNEPHPVSARTLEECELIFIPGDSFMDSLNRSAALSNKLLNNLSHEYGVWVNRVTMMGQKNVKERLALSLLILHAKFQDKDGVTAPIDLSRADLANYVGTAIETLVRMLNQFKADRIISSKGRKITILNMNELERLADLH